MLSWGAIKTKSGLACNGSKPSHLQQSFILSLKKYGELQKDMLAEIAQV